MLNKNAYTIIVGMANKASSGDMTLPDGTTCSVYLNGNMVQNYPQTTARAFDAIGAKNSDQPNYNATCLYFGTGDTAPSVSDYKLSGDIIEGLRHGGAPFFVNISNGYAELQATAAVQNTNSNAVTIKEIGFTAYLYSITHSGWKNFLVDHTVLATPITIPAGETKSITYNIRFTLPTA